MANVGQEFKFDQFTGLFTSANPFSRAPKGAFDVLDNCVIKQPGIVEPRRGFSLQSSNPGGNPAASTTSVISAGISYILGHIPAAGQVLVSQTTTAASAVMTQPIGTSFAGKLSVPFNAPRARFARLLNSYVSTGFGLFVSEDLSTLRPTVFPVVPATFGTASAPGSFGQGDYGSTATIGTSGQTWLPSGSWVSYVFVVCRKGVQLDLTIGPVSDSIYVANTGGTANVLLTITQPVMLPPDAFIRVYRTKSVPTSQNLPFDYYLVTELALTQNAGPLGYLNPDTGGSRDLGGHGSSIAYTDIVPDGALYVPLYTNPTDGGGAQSAANTPPIMADVAAYKGALWGGNTKDVERFILQLTGVDASNGLAVGATFTIDGITYTWGTNQLQALLSAPTRQPCLVTAGLPSQNVIFSSMELVAHINWWYAAQFAAGSLLPEQLLRAQYITGQNGAPGQILLQRLVPGGKPFTVSASSPNGIGNNLTGVNGQSNNNAQVAQIVYTPYGQPNSWPTANNQTIGDPSADILRIISTKDTLWIFKKDGLWTLQASPTPTGTFQINVVCFDPSIILVSPDSAVVLNNEIFALCREGVLQINAQGKTNVSLPIQRDMQRQLDYLFNPTMTTGATFGQNAAWGMAYESEHVYMLALPESTQAYPTKHYIYEADTGAWSTWSFQQPLLFGLVDKGLNQVVLSALNGQQWLERKNYNSYDHQDVPFTIACPAPGSLSSLTFPNAGHGISVGDIVLQIQGGTGTPFPLQRCTAVSGALVTLDAAPAVPWNLTGGAGPYLLSILPGGPTPSQIATGSLVAATGQAVTCARSTSAYCRQLNGLVTLIGPNLPRVEPKGLLCESPKTNICLWCRDLTNAVWTASGAAVARATGYDGVANAGSNVTATAPNGTVSQSITAAGQASIGSFAIRRKTGTGTVLISVDGGTTQVDVTSLLNSSTYTEVATAPTNSVLANPTLWLRLATTGDSVDVDFGQVETGFGNFFSGPATSRIATTTAPVTRDGDVNQTTNPFVGLNPSSWVIGLTVTPLGPTWLSTWQGTPSPEIFFFQVIGDAFPNSIVAGCKDGSQSNFYVEDGTGNYQRVIAPSVLAGNATTALTYKNVSGVMTMTPGVGVNDGLGTGTGQVTTQGNPVYINAQGGEYGGLVWVTDFFMAGSIGAPLTIQKGITSQMRMLPIIGPTELFAKQFDETVQLYFRTFDCEFYSGSVATDEQPVTGALLNPYIQNTYTTNAWGNNNWGDNLWGGANTMNFVSIVNIPRMYSRAAELQLTLVFNNACTRFELIGLSVGASKSITERIVKA